MDEHTAPPTKASAKGRRWLSAPRSHIFPPVFILAVFMAACMSTRIALLFLYPDDFSELTGGDLLFAFARGALFDASIILTFAGVPLLMLLLPFEWAFTRWWRGLWGWPLFVLFAVFAFLLGGDTIHFGYLHRHFGPEVLAALSDTDLMTTRVLKSYPVMVTAGALGLSALAWAWKRLLTAPVKPVTSKIRSLALVAFIIPLAIFIIRGCTLAGRTMNIVTALEGTSPAGGNLTLNEPFSLYHSWRNTKSAPSDFFPFREARSEVLAVLQSDDEIGMDKKYPLLRRRIQTQPATLNVVLILLESWDAEHVDVLRKDSGLAPEGATPEFDALSKEGLLFTRFYANGQRSVEGVLSSIAGIPTVPGMPGISFGIELNRLGFIGQLAKGEGYTTYFVQGSKRSSYRFDALAPLAGLDNYYGREDIPLTDHSDHPDKKGSWDYDTLRYAHSQFASAPEPFFGLVFTLSTHPPHNLPTKSKKWKIYRHNTPLNRYLNVLHYSDWALGRFFELARSAGYFDRTVFVLMADHVSGLGRETARDIPAQPHIPCHFLSSHKDLHSPLIIGRGKGVVDHILSILPSSSISWGLVEKRLWTKFKLLLELSSLLSQFGGWPMGYVGVYSLTKSYGKGRIIPLHGFNNLSLKSLGTGCVVGRD